VVVGAITRKRKVLWVFLNKTVKIIMILKRMRIRIMLIVVRMKILLQEQWLFRSKILVLQIRVSDDEESKTSSILRPFPLFFWEKCKCFCMFSINNNIFIFFFACVLYFVVVCVFSKKSNLSPLSLTNLLNKT